MTYKTAEIVFFAGNNIIVSKSAAWLRSLAVFFVK